MLTQVAASLIKVSGLPERLKFFSKKPIGLVELGQSDRAPRNLSPLQVFHGGLLFLTFLPGSARRSPSRNYGSDPGLEDPCSDFLKTFVSAQATVAQP